MGYMLNGVYKLGELNPQSAESGEYKRAASTIRDEINPNEKFDPQRYHLFVAWNCPWAHRTILTLVFKDLFGKISLSIAKPRRDENGWVYDSDGPFSDPLLGVSAVNEVYAMQSPSYTGRITVPVLWDKQDQRIISNESADIIRMLDRASKTGLTLRSPETESRIQFWNDLIYPNLNNGVYRAGFARTQSAYQDAAHQVFETLDQIEDQLSQTRYLCGSEISEADVRLFPTLARFDVAYHGAFKCNLRRIIDYPNLWAYARDIYQQPHVKQTVFFEIYKQGYYSPSELRNPLGIVPIGPINDWDEPHGRG